MGGKPKPIATRNRERTGARKTSTVSKRAVPEEPYVGGRPQDVEPPADLPPAAREFWNRTVEILFEARVAQVVDWPALRIMAVQVARVELSREALVAPATAALEDLDARIAELAENRAYVAGRLAVARGASWDMSPDDVAKLAKIDVTLTNLKEYRRLQEVTGGMVALGSTGQIVENPLVATERAAGALVLRYLAEFGLTPSSRARLAIAGLTGTKIASEIEDELGPSGRKKRGQIAPAEAAS